MEDELHFGSIIDIDDSISYHGSTLEETYDHFVKAVDDYCIIVAMRDVDDIINGKKENQNWDYYIKKLNKDDL